MFVTTVVASFVLLVRPIKGLATLLAGSGLDQDWSPKDLNHAFIDHMLGMTIGWSWQPYFKSLYTAILEFPYPTQLITLGKGTLTQVTVSISPMGMKGGLTIAYSLIAIPLMFHVHTWLFSVAPEPPHTSKQVKASTDADYADGGTGGAAGGGGGGGGGDGGGDDAGGDDGGGNGGDAA